MMPEIPPASPERDEAYAAIRDSLARALEEMSKQLWRLHHLGLPERPSWATPTMIERCAFSLKFTADELRDGALEDVLKFHDRLYEAAVALGGGIFIIRNLKCLLRNAPSR